MLAFYLSLIDDNIDKLHFNDLYDKYKIEVMQFANSLIKNYHDAEDVSQEAWLVIARRFNELRLENDGSIKAFLMRIVKYKSIDIMRKKDRISSYTLELDSSIDNIQTDDDTVLLTICQKESEETIYKCINSLDEIYRDVLSLYYLNQSSPKEIADFFSMDIRAVRKRIERGRVMLINLLKEKGEANEKQI